MLTRHSEIEIKNLRPYVNQTKYLIIHEHFNYETSSLVDGGLFVTLSSINEKENTITWGFSEEEAIEYNIDVIEELLTDHAIDLFE